MIIPIPEIIDLSHPEKYIFTLKIHPEKFSFTLYDPIHDGSFFYYEIPGIQGMDILSGFKQIFFENTFFASPFRKVFLLNYSSEFTFIPAFLYEEKYNEEMMQFNFSNPDGKLLTQKLRNPEMVILHSMPEDIYQFLNRSFVNPLFIHHLSPLITYFQGKSKQVNALQLIVNWRENDLDILCFSHGNFVLGNHFKVREIQDVVYYTLLIFKQLNLNQKKDFLYISGERIQKTELMKQLKSFVYNIIPVNIATNACFSGIDTQLVPFELSSLSLCEL